VRFFTYNAPTSTQEGNVYVIVDTRFFKDDYKEKNIADLIDPKTYTDISGNEFLRLYRLPWDDNLVKSMNKAQKKKQMIILTKKSSGKLGNLKKGRNKDTDTSGGTGGTSKHSKDKSKYSVEARVVNEVFRKGN
jgi:hypothetical protein